MARYLICFCKSDNSQIAIYPIKNAIVPDELIIPQDTEIFFVMNKSKEEFTKIQEQLTMIDFIIGHRMAIPEDTEKNTVYIVGKELKHDEKTITIMNKSGIAKILKNPKVKFEVVDM